MDTNLPILTRQEVAKWYGLTVHGLRQRFKMAGIHIPRRLLTITDVQYIITKLGIPPYLPSGILPP